jgi:hypothetical protein
MLHRKRNRTDLLLAAIFAAAIGATFTVFAGNQTAHAIPSILPGCRIASHFTKLYVALKCRSQSARRLFIVFFTDKVIHHEYFPGIQRHRATRPPAV